MLPFTTAAFVILSLAAQTSGTAPNKNKAMGQTVAGTAAPVDARALPKPGEHVLVGAGDIADCKGAAAGTANLVSQVLASSAQAHAFTAGDNAYPVGSVDDFRRCYEPTWGRFRDRTIPVAGNHDWGTEGAAGYFSYFGKRAGTAAEPWRSVDIGTWHVVLLDSDCKEVGGCGPGSPQARWLEADLAKRGPGCTLAIWHHPRFSSSVHGNDKTTEPLWKILEAHDADLVVQGHDHTYERFAALTSVGAPGPRGIPSFVVGTGGRAAYPFGFTQAGSVVRMTGVAGVLVLFLDARGYRFRFVDVAGRIRDEGEGACR